MYSYRYHRTEDDMTKTDSQGDATASELISRYIEERTDWRGEAHARIRKVFHEADPAITIAAVPHRNAVIQDERSFILNPYGRTHSPKAVVQS